jgi:hypothetical protein
MEKLKPFSHLLLFVVLASCTISVDGDASSESITFYRSDIAGRWVPVNHSDAPAGTEISAFELLEDSTAKVEVMDASGDIQRFDGTWRLGPEGSVGPVSYMADMSLLYGRDSTSLVMKGITFKDDGEKKILAIGEAEFEKE